MLQFTLMTDRDRKEAAQIEKRRAYEEERRKRIFNPRIRLMGADYTALGAQIEEKKKMVAEQKKVDQVFEEQLCKNDQIALALARREDEERKKIALEVNDFRKNFQRFEDRREFDLNDPGYLKKLLPARLHDDDPRIGLAAVQKFEGEDIYGEERRKIQKEQLQSWLEQQMEERKAADKERKMADDAYKAAVIARDERALELDRMEKDCRKRLDAACSKYNLSLASERECKERERRRQEMEDNMAEMYNTLTSDMMTENPDVSLSAFGGPRRIGYLYKGMSPEEKAAFRQDQLAQIEEEKKRKAEEKRFQQDWDAYSNGIQRSIAAMDREAAAKEKERQKAIQEENKRMAEEHRKHKEYMEKIVYRNTPTAAFYEQFNSSTR